MSDVISQDLRSRFESHPDEPTHREAVIITSEDPIDAGTLEDAGFQVRFVTRDGTIAAGELDRATLSRVAQLSGIVAIEPDTQMYALDEEITPA